MAFNDPDFATGLSNLAIRWPTDWDKTVPEWNQPGYLRYLRPWGVKTGDKWTGLTTRATGAWDPVLTGYIQGLLSVMFDDGGSQWTVMRLSGRQPTLLLREIPDADDPNIIHVDVLNPGIELGISRDFTQSANVIFGEGSDIAGTIYSGMQVSPDGQTTFFTPFAYSPTVYPTRDNPNRNRFIIPKQAHIKFPAGLDSPAAAQIARSQLKRFADPGFTGTLKLTTDPRRASGEPIPRFLVQAGDTLRLVGLLGSRDGALVHVTESVVSTDGSVSLTIDSKYRDQLTVAEVRARTRDALTPLRSLQVGKYSNTVQDLILPWSYQEGSGSFPIGARFFWEKLPKDAIFPYESFTKQFPPKDHPNWYVRIGPTHRENATLNWAGRPWKKPYQDYRDMYRELFDVSGPEDTGAVDAVVTITFQTTAPSSPVKNDVWIDTDHERKKYRWSGNKWKPFYSLTFRDLIDPIPNSFTGSVKLTFKVDPAPTSPHAYDLWIRRPDGQTSLRDDINTTWDVIPQPKRPQLRRQGFSLRLSQAGTIRLTQFAAYDRNGNVMPVKFHVSIYNSNTVTNGSMPAIEKTSDDSDPPGTLVRYLHPPGGDNYKAGDRNPFIENGWEQVTSRGTTPDNMFNLVADGGTLLVGWGTFYEPAGYYPGRKTRGADPTGLLRDETNWSYDKNQFINKMEGDSREGNLEDAMSTVMVYCDDQGDEPVFFQGRMYRQEPGAS
jgi:hypothetical protein